jgi:SAM-dependent methyltransferase
MADRRFPVRPCAVCGGVELAPIFRQRFETPSGGYLLDGYTLVACERCGFCFADDVPDQAAFDRYYREMSKYEHGDTDGRQTPHELVRFRELAAIIREFIPARSSRILEFGCATGGLLAELQSAGYTDLTGIDPSPSCAAAVRRLYGIPASAGTLTDLDVRPGSSDFLILLGVLEHVRDLAGATRKMADLLAPQGRVFIAVPDASRYTQGQDAPFQDISVEHINYFGPTSLANLMGSHGFRELGRRPGMVEYSHRTFVPVVSGAYEKDGAVRPPMRDEDTRADMVEYVRQSAATDAGIRERIDTLARDRRPIIVWGIGAHTMRLLVTSRLAEANVAAWVDSNPHLHGRQLRSAPIIAPADLARYGDLPILISSRVFQIEIAAKIRDEMRLPNEVITLYDLS